MSVQEFVKERWYLLEAIKNGKIVTNCNDLYYDDIVMVHYILDPAKELSSFKIKNTPEQQAEIYFEKLCNNKYENVTTFDLRNWFIEGFLQGYKLKENE